MSWMRAIKIGGGLALVNYIVVQYVIFVSEVGHHDLFIAVFSLFFLLGGVLMFASGWKNMTMREFVEKVILRK